MRKSFALLWIMFIFIGSMSFSFAESALVNKVVFRDMNGDVYGVSLKQVRFYDAGGSLISSGTMIRNEELIAETDVFTVTPSSSYNGTGYAPYSAFNTASDNSLWLSKMNNKENEKVTVDFKSNQEISKIEFITRGHVNNNHNISGVFNVDVYDSLDNMTTYVVDAETNQNEVITINLEAPAQGIRLNVESEDYEVAKGEIFKVDVKLTDATDIYANDITISFDDEMFELVDSEVADTDAYEIFHKDESTSGNVRFIVASTNKNYGITGEAIFLKLTFKSRGVEGESDIKVISGLVADNTGKEIEPTLLGKTYIVLKGYVDVNGDEIFTLGDLAIASYYVDEPSDSWGSYTPDIDNSGDVASLDLNLIVTEILK